MIETIATISSIVITASSIIIAVIQTIRKKKQKRTTAGETAKREIAEAENDHLHHLVELAKIVQKIPNFINEAEEIIGDGKGLAKLKYVLNNIQMQCQLAEIEFNEEEFKEEVEKILETPQKKKTTTEIYHQWYKNEMEGTYD